MPRNTRALIRNRLRSPSKPHTCMRSSSVASYAAKPMQRQSPRRRTICRISAASLCPLALPRRLQAAAQCRRVGDYSTCASSACTVTARWASNLARLHPRDPLWGLTSQALDACQPSTYLFIVIHRCTAALLHCCTSHLAPRTSRLARALAAAPANHALYATNPWPPFTPDGTELRKGAWITLPTSFFKTRRNPPSVT